MLHILTAAGVLTSMAYSYCLWQSAQPNKLTGTLFGRIQTQTVLIIIPFAVFELATGFTMLSLKHYPVTQRWISGSIMSFMVVIASWLAFMYFLLLSQQVPLSIKNNDRTNRYRRTQFCFLLICAFGLLCMVFFMANKTGSL